MQEEEPPTDNDAEDYNEMPDEEESLGEAERQTRKLEREMSANLPVLDEDSDDDIYSEAQLWRAHKVVKTYWILIIVSHGGKKG